MRIFLMSLVVGIKNSDNGCMRNTGSGEMENGGHWYYQMIET